MAGISGGADSVCLFSAALELKRNGFCILCGYTSTTDTAGRRLTGDEQFVRDLCEKYGVPLQVFRWIWNQRQKEETISGGSRAGDPQGIV